MANCHKQFLEFNSKITLDAEKKDSLRTSRDAVRDKIRKYFKEEDNGFSPKMNVSAASGRSITSLHSHASRLDSAQQLPSDAVFDGRSRAAENEPKGDSTVKDHL